MKKYISIFFSLVIFIAGFSIPVFAAQSGDSPKKIVSMENFEQEQLDFDSLYDLARRDILINNNLTKVSKTNKMQNGDYVSTVKMEKIISIKKLNDGTEISNNAISATSSISKSDWLSTDIKLTSTIYYEKVTFSGHTCYKVTKYSSKQELSEPRYHVKTLHQEVIQNSGKAFNSDGKALGYKGESSSYTQSSPKSGTTYSKNTKFKYYMSTSPSHNIGSNARLTYEYNGNTKHFDLDLELSGS